LSADGSPAETLTIRLPKGVRRDIEEHARRNNRSLSQELVQCWFDARSNAARPDAIVDAFGGPQSFALFQMMAGCVRALEAGSGKKWFDHPKLYEVAVEVINEMTGYLKPKGSSRSWPPGSVWGTFPRKALVGAIVRGHVANVLRSPDWDAPPSTSNKARLTLTSQHLKVFGLLPRFRRLLAANKPRRA